MNSMKEYRRSVGTAPLILNLDTTNKSKCSNSTTPLDKLQLSLHQFLQNSKSLIGAVCKYSAPTSVKFVCKLWTYIHLGRYVKCVWHCTISRDGCACSTTFPKEFCTEFRQSTQSQIPGHRQTDGEMKTDPIHDFFFVISQMTPALQPATSEGLILKIKLIPTQKRLTTSSFSCRAFKQLQKARGSRNTVQELWTDAPLQLPK